MHFPLLNFKSSHFMCIKEEACEPFDILLYYCTAIFHIAITVSTKLHVIHQHFICLMLLFQSHVACQNFTPCDYGHDYEHRQPSGILKY